MKATPTVLDTPVLAYSISFPSTSLPGETVTYITNEVWETAYGDWDTDEDDELEENQ
jgi:hypothetical protein